MTATVEGADVVVVTRVVAVGRVERRLVAVADPSTYRPGAGLDPRLARASTGSATSTAG